MLEIAVFLGLRGINVQEEGKNDFEGSQNKNTPSFSFLLNALER